MRVPNDFKCDPAEAPYGPLEPRTASLIAFPVSSRHTVRSVSQEAHRSLWAAAFDRAERWRRVGNMDQVLGVGRPFTRSANRSSKQPSRRCMEWACRGLSSISTLRTLGP